MVGTKNRGQGHIQLFRGSVEAQIHVTMPELGFEPSVEALIRLIRFKSRPSVEALIRLTGLGIEPRT